MRILSKHINKNTFSTQSEPFLNHLSSNSDSLLMRRAAGRNIGMIDVVVPRTPI